MKKFFQDLIARKEQRATALRSIIEKATDVAEARNAMTELEAVNGELTEARAKLTEIEAAEARGNGQGFNPVASYGAGAGQPAAGNDNDPRATIEYRTAFMNYVRTGEMNKVLEKRADDRNELADLGILIPTTIVNEIIKGVEKVYGQLYSRVKKTNVKGGVKYPIGSFGATFNRIGETGAPTDRQAGGSVTGYVEFGYLIGEIRLAQTLLMTVMGVDVFERELANIIVETYVQAMDKEIMLGKKENNQCEGILTEAAKVGGRIPADHIISFTADEMADWKSWQTKLFAIIPLSMRGLRPEFVMTPHTFEANIETLEDSNGQPVARNIYNPTTGAETATFKGRQVVFVEEDILKNFNDAADGEYFGMYWVGEKAYAINSNLQFAVTRYWDNEKNEYVQKGLVINDGKVLDPKYLYLLKKSVSA